MLYVYASDDFEGRETGTPGQKKAVDYIREAYKKLGVEAAKADGDYFQEVPLEVAQPPEGSVNVNTVNYELGEHILTFSALEKDFDTIVYMGYGIDDTTYSDYTNQNVAGKLIMVKDRRT